MTAVADDAAQVGTAAVPSKSPSRTFIHRHATLLCGLLLAVGTLSLYGRAIGNDFVNCDDPVYVTKNAIVQGGLTWSNLRWALTSTSEANWHPLTWISHMADVSVFGLHPAGHHLHNNILHTINVVLLFLLVLQFTGSRVKSLLVAGLFAIHPLNVESVAWIAERKSLLSTLFLLLGLAAYGWYVSKRTIGRYLAVALCFAMGLMAKPMVITFPFCLLLLDYWPLNRLVWTSSGADFRRAFFTLIREKIPLFAMSAASAAITMYAQQQGGAVKSLTVVPLGRRLGNAVYSYLKYLEKGIWPSDLAVFYPHPGAALALWKVLGAAAALLSITVIVWRQKKCPYLLVGWLWYLGTMIPVIGIVQVGGQAMADRYTYVPFMGLFVIVALLADEVISRPLPTFRIGIVAAAVGLVGATYVQIGYWRNSVTLFTHALRVTPDNAFAESSLGTALLDMGRLNEAAYHLQTAIRLTPGFLPQHYTLGMIFQRQNRLEEAEREYQMVIDRSTDPAESAQSHNNLGVLFSQENQLDRAVREFDAAIRINPNEQNSYLGRGLIEYQRGQAGAAVGDFRRATQIAPSAMAYLWLGSACESERDETCATQAYEGALQLSPGLTEARNRLKLLREKGQAPAN
jgi:protein O-mannosyl-transferase